MNFIRAVKKDKIFLTSFFFIILLYIFKIIIIANSTLIDDEAHYALWTKHLPIGFFDHGPGIAFFMKATMLIFGDNGFGVRIGSIIASIILSVFLYLFFKKQKDINAGVIAVILFNTVPFFTGLSLIVTIDTPMFLFLLASIMAYYNAMYVNKKYFYLAGFLFGFSLLSKEGAIFVGSTIILFMLISKKRKEILLSKEFYLSFVVAFIVYIPFIIYNFQTDFIFIKYALHRQLQKPGSLNRTGDFWLAQFGLLSPLFFILFLCLTVAVFVKFLRKKEIEERAYFAFISLIPLLYILQKSFKNKLEANWGLFIYGGGFFIIAYFVAKNWHKKSMRTIFLINILFSNFLMFFVIVHYFIPIVKINGDPTDRYYRYNAIRYDIKEYYDKEMDKTKRIFGLNYQIPSMVNFYLNPDIEAVCLNWGTYHPTSFDFWYKDNSFIGNDMYYISENENKELAEKYFESVEYITNFKSMRNTKNVGNFYIFLAKNYQGRQLDYIYESEKLKF